MENPLWERVLIDWVNCLKLSNPIQKLDDLRDGLFFSNLHKLTKKSSDTDCDILTYIFDVLNEHYSDFIIHNKTIIHLSDLPKDDLCAITSLLMHYTIMHDRRDVLTSPLCYNLQEFTQIKIRSFLEKVQDNVNHAELARIINSCIEDNRNYNFISSPLHTSRNSPLHDVLKTPAVKSTRLFERDKEIAKLKANLELVQEEKEIAEKDLQSQIERNKKLEKQLGQKTVEISNLRSEVLELENRTPPHYRDKDYREMQKILRTKVDSLEQILEQSDKENLELREERDKERAQVKQLESRCKTWLEKFIDADNNLTSITENYKELQLKNENLQEHCRELEALLDELKPKAINDTIIEESFQTLSRRSRSLGSQSEGEDLAHSVIDVQLKELQKENQAIKANLDHEQNNCNQLRDEIDTLTLETSVLNGEKIQLELELQAANGKIEEFTMNYQELHENWKILTQNKNFLEAAKAGLINENQNMQKSIEKLTNDAGELSKLLAKCKEEKDLLGETINNLTASKQLIETEFKTMINEKTSIEDCLTETISKLHLSSMLNSEYLEKLNIAKTERNNLEEEIRNLKNNNEHLLKTYQELNMQFETVNNNLVDVSSKLEESSELNKKLEQKIHELNTELQNLTNKSEDLSNEKKDILEQLKNKCTIVAELSSSIQELQNDKLTLTEELGTVISGNEALLEEVDKTRQELHQVLVEKDELLQREQEEKFEIEQKFKNAEIQLSDKIDDNTRLKKTLEDIVKAKEDLQQQLDTTKTAYDKLMLDIIDLNDELTKMTEDRNNVIREKENISNTLDTLQISLVKVHDEAHILSVELESSKESFGQLLTLKNDIEQQLQAVVSEKCGMETELKEISLKLEECSVLNSQYLEKLTAATNEKVAIDAEKQELINKCKELGDSNNVISKEKEDVLTELENKSQLIIEMSFKLSESEEENTEIKENLDKTLAEKVQLNENYESVKLLLDQTISEKNVLDEELTKTVNQKDEILNEKNRVQKDFENSQTSYEELLQNLDLIEKERGNQLERYTEHLNSMLENIETVKNTHTQDVNSLKQIIAELNKQMNALANTLEEATTSRDELSEKLTKCQEECNAFLVTNNDLENQLREALNNNEDIKKCSENILSEKHNISEELKNTNAKFHDLEVVHENLRVENNTLRDSITALRSDNSQLSEKLAKVTEHLESAIEDFSTENKLITEKLNEKAEVLQNAILEKDTLTEKLTEKEEILEKIILEKNTLAEQFNEKEDMLEKFISEKDSLTENLNEKEEFIKKVFVERDSLTEKLNEKEEIIKKIILEKDMSTEKLNEKEKIFEKIILEKDTLTEKLTEKEEILEKVILEKNMLTEKLTEKRDILEKIILEKDSLTEKVAALENELISKNQTTLEEETKFECAILEQMEVAKQLQSENVTLTDKLATLIIENETTSAKLNECTENISEMSASLKTTLEEKDSIFNSYKDAEDKLIVARKEVDTVTVELNKVIQELNQCQLNKEESILEQMEVAKQLQAENVKLSDKLAVLTVENETTSAKLNECTEKISEITASLKTTLEEKDSIFNSYKDAEDKLTVARKEVDTITVELNKVTQELNQCQLNKEESILEQMEIAKQLQSENVTLTEKLAALIIENETTSAKFNECTENISEITASLKTTLEEKDSIFNSYKDAEDKLTVARKEVDTITVELNKVTQELNQCQLNKEESILEQMEIAKQLQSENVTLTEKLAALIIENETTSAKFNECTENISEMSASLKTTLEEKDSIFNSYKDAEDKLIVARKEVDTVTLELNKVIQELNQCQLNKEESILEQMEVAKQLQAENVKLSDKLAVLTIENETTYAKLNECTEKISEITASLKTTLEEKDSIFNSYKDAEDKLTVARKEVDTITVELNKVTQELNQCQLNKEESILEQMEIAKQLQSENVTLTEKLAALIIENETTSAKFNECTEKNSEISASLKKTLEENDSISNNYKDAEDKMVVACKEVDTITVELNRVTQELNQCQLNKEEEIRNLKLDITRLTTEKVQLDDTIKKVIEEKSVISKFFDLNNNELQNIQQKHDELLEALQESNRIVGNLQEERGQLLAEIENLTKVKNEFSEQLDRVSQENVDATEKIQSLLKKNFETSEECKSLNEKIDQLTGENADMLGTFTTLSHDLDEKIRNEAILESACETLRAQLDEKSEILDKLSEEHKDIFDIVDKLSQEIMDNKKTIDLLSAEKMQLTQQVSDLLNQIQDLIQEKNKLIECVDLTTKELQKVKKDRNEILEGQTKIMKETQSNLILAHQSSVEIKNDLMKRIEMAETEKEILRKQVEEDTKKIQDTYMSVMTTNSKLELEIINLRKKIEDKNQKLNEYVQIKEAYEKLLEENSRLMTEVDTIKYKRSRDREEFVNLLKKEREDATARESKRVKEVRNEYEGKLEKMKEKMLKLYRVEVGKQMMKVNAEQSETVCFVKTIEDLRNDLFEAQQKLHMLETERDMLRINEAQMNRNVQASRESLRSIPDARDSIRSSVTSLRSIGTKNRMETVQMVQRGKSTSTSVLPRQNREVERKTVTLPRRVAELQETVTISRRTSLTNVPSMPMEDEDDDFNNKYLADLKAGHCVIGDSVKESNVRFSELAWRNSLVPPHLKSSYPLETQFASPSKFKDDELKVGNICLDDSLSKLLPGEKPRQKKDFGTTAYKKPGPPTPSKNGGRLSLQGNEIQPLPLREQNEKTPTKKVPTPSRIRALFGISNSRDNSENRAVTPRTKQRLLIFRKQR
ncbi:repetitive organellar protein-like [Diabrotica virgifera virgifera]|uniref:COP1-interactive protein 1-like n=1 Tax=Diabrotica virgifera virgifera TaxID=50390 RepID=A0ABM5JKB1_DIAVI|nr:repetitive organellar protein-like [Diabrotica virgifera virgifera]